MQDAVPTTASANSPAAARGARSRKAFSTISGPTPAGSPMVSPRMGLVMALGHDRFGEADQEVWRAEAAGFGDHVSSSQRPPAIRACGTPGISSPVTSSDAAPSACNRP